MTFWETFSNLCIDKGEKANPVAKKLNISSGTVTMWKNGSVPSGDNLIKIADYFNVTVDYLLGREAPKYEVQNVVLSENEQKIVNLFKQLTDTQQGRIIERAEIMANESNKIYTSKIVASGGDNKVYEVTEEQLRRTMSIIREDDYN